MKWALVLLAALSAGLCAQMSSQDRVPVLVELFTSEGCPDCPEADELLQRVDRDQPFGGAEIVVLSEHVDLFDGLGWRDPSSSRVYTDRERDYAAMIGGRLIARSVAAQHGGSPLQSGPNRTEVYTPEFFIDGMRGFAGGDWGDLERASRDAALSRKGVLLVRAERRARQTQITIQTSEKPDGILLVALAHERVTSQVRTGANAGRTLSHVAVVYSLREVGDFRPVATGYEREVMANVQPESRIVAFVAKGPVRTADDAVTLTEKALGRNLKSSGIGRVTAIGVCRFERAK